MCGDLPEARHAAVRALRDPASGDRLDEALVLRFDGPHSATGDDVVEFHCHGGRAVTEAVLAALGGQPGMRLAEPGEFTRRAMLNGRIDLTEAEGLADLLAAETESQRRAALALTEGGLSRQIDEWRQQLLQISAVAELAIDYVGEPDGADAPDQRAPVAALRAAIEEWLSRPRVEPLHDGLRIVVAGPPNVGKSSLINAIVGVDRVIVSPEAGTTRDHVDVPLAIAGVPVRLTDTAGLREAEAPIEAEGIARARRLIELADILLWLGEVDVAPSHRHLILVQPKVDRLEKREPGRLPVSSVTGEGLGALMERIRAEAALILPREGEAALNARQALELEVAAEGLALALGSDDPVLIAEGLRQARTAFDRVTGRAGVEDFLDCLFSRFCLGK